MTFTYDLSSSDATELLISNVRLTIPDNDSTAYDLEDAEIEYFLDQVGNNVKAAALAACKMLVRKYSKKVTFSDAGFSIRHTERAERFQKAIDQLSTEVAGSYSTVDITREDGYSDAATDSEYQSRIVYIET